MKKFDIHYSLFLVRYSLLPPYFCCAFLKRLLLGDKSPVDDQHVCVNPGGKYYVWSY
jgi:hypothetical protein